MYDAAKREIPCIKLARFPIATFTVESHIVSGVPNGVHGMRSHLENTIEGEVLVDKVEEIAPVCSSCQSYSFLLDLGHLTPGVILHNTMRIQLDPEVEEEEDGSSNPASGSKIPGLANRLVSSGHGEKNVGDEIIHEDQIDDPAENEPSVVLDRSILKLVISALDLSGNLGFDILANKLVEQRLLLLIKDTVLLSPLHHLVILRLSFQEVTDSIVVSRTPKGEHEQQNRCPDDIGQCKVEENVKS